MIQCWQDSSGTADKYKTWDAPVNRTLVQDDTVPYM